VKTRNIIIPRDTDLLLELQTDLNTERAGGRPVYGKDRVTVRIAGATVEDASAKYASPALINAPDTLVIDRIVLNENRWSNLSATLARLCP